jgi:prephenate dehydratase
VTTVAYLGPPGTFSEEALLTQADLAESDLTEYPSMTEVLLAVADGHADLGFVAVENAIEGTVNVTLDTLIFETDLYIQREVVLPVHQHLLARPGTRLADVTTIVSIPVASAQCRSFFRANLPGVAEMAATSTAEAARMVGEGQTPPGSAAVGTVLAAKLYGLEVVAHEIEDHPDNATRFVLVARPGYGIPGPTGHDRSSIVCFQYDDRPGSLHAILGQFSARGINLTKLESRPTKRGLGDYCFIIDLEGHIADELVADALRELHASLAEVKFLGSYPAAGAHGDARRAEADAAWRAAEAWMSDLRSRLRS